MPTKKIIPTKKTIPGSVPEYSKTKNSPLRDSETVTNANRYVYVEKGVTKNMGDYNSAKVTVGVSLPFGATSADIDAANAAVTMAMEMVDKRIEEEVDKLIQ